MDTCQGWHVWLSVPPPLLAFYARPVCDFFSPGYLPLCWAVSVGCCCCCVFSCLITLPSLVTNIMGTPEREGDRRRERECVCECECASETPSLFCLRSLSEILRKSLPNFSICSETEICFCFGEEDSQKQNPRSKQLLPPLRLASPRLTSLCLTSSFQTTHTGLLYIPVCFCKLPSSLPFPPFPIVSLFAVVSLFC